MEISGLQSAHQLMLQQIQSQQTLNATASQATNETKTSFADLFTEQITETNQLQYNADMELQSFVTGDTQNIHDVMVSMEEAKIALELTTQVRNKMIDMYQELKSIQM